LRAAIGLVTCLGAIACSGGTPSRIACGANNSGCACSISGTPNGFDCSTVLQAGSVCCAIAGWPTDGNSTCVCSNPVPVTCRMENSSLACSCFQGSYGSLTPAEACGDNNTGCCLSKNSDMGEECYCPITAGCNAGDRAVISCEGSTFPMPACATGQITVPSCRY
jgi:hypothetical protein